MVIKALHLTFLKIVGRKLVRTFEGLAGNVYKDITIINRVKMKGCLSQSAF